MPCIQMFHGSSMPKITDSLLQRRPHVHNFMWWPASAYRDSSHIIHCLNRVIKALILSFLCDSQYGVDKTAKFNCQKLPLKIDINLIECYLGSIDSLASISHIIILSLQCSKVFLLVVLISLSISRSSYTMAMTLSIPTKLYTLHFLFCEY